MELKVSSEKWSAGLPVVIIEKSTAEKLGIHTKERISLRKVRKNSTYEKEFFSIVDIVEKQISPNEIILSEEIKNILNIHTGDKVDINLSLPSKSLNFIKEKLNGKRLTESQMKQIIQDVVNNSLSETEIALFVSGMYRNGMVFEETISLIKAILNCGERISFKGKLVVDKHSIGGVAGNRTTPIVVSICASQGLIMPKSSSRAITSAAGTADVIETLARVDFNINELKKIVKKTNASMIWGGGLELVPADSKIITIEKQLNIDPEAQLLASIMSKKLAVGSKYILIDIPYGKTAKVSKSRALNLKEKFERIGKYFHLKLKVVLTDGSQPIGNGIGPALEMIDVLKVLNQDESRPKDLEKKALFLAGEILEMSGKSKKGNGIKLAESVLKSGQAFKKFKEIILAQDGKMKDLSRSFKFSKNILSNKNCKIKEIDNIKISNLAREAGCPSDKFSGLYIHVKKGDKIKKGDKLITIYSESKPRLKEAVKFYEQKNPFVFS
ncbi:MAG: thymidine phosphorylase [Candidatus Pacearchaeota archaeon]|jgi:putative thymidine phosphorylase